MTRPTIFPGIHPGISREQYDVLDAVNQSTLKVMRRSPAHYRHALANPREETDALRFGQAVHLACYEPARFAAEVIELPKFDRRTKAGKEDAAAWEVENAGKLAIDADEYATLAAMQKSVLAHPFASKLIAKAGEREATVVWKDEQTGLLCKARMDHLLTNRNVVDLKTTRDASPGAFARDVLNFGYHFQGSFYLDGVKAADGVSGGFVMIAVEKEAPYAVAVYELAAASVELGRIEYRRALERLAECRASGLWPAYSDSIEEIQVPAWALRKENIELLEIES